MAPDSSKPAGKPGARPIAVVSSAQNPVFKACLEALESDKDIVLVHGLKAVRDLAEKLKPKTLIAKESYKLEESESASALFKMRFPDPVTRMVLSDPLFKQLDPFGVPDVIAAFEKPTLEKWTPGPVTRPTLLLATQNPANLGACLRSAAAFGIRDVVCLKEAASPFHPRAIRGSMGLVFDLKISRGPSINAVDLLSEAPIVALDMGGKSLHDFDWPQNPVILIGEEGAGVPADLKAVRVSIPMNAGVESLNAAVSCGIALYDFRSTH